jgi:hypothetical protein
MSKRFKHEDVSAVPAGWRVRTVKHGDHRVRVAFPPGRRHTGSGRLVSVLHPIAENPSCTMRSSNPAELLIMGANPPRKFAVTTKLEKQREARERAARIRAARLNSQMYAVYSTRETGKLQLDKVKRSLKEADILAYHLRERGYAAQVVGPRGRLDFTKHLNPAELLIMGANPENASSVYSKAVSMGYPYARGDGRTAPDGRTWLSRFTKDSEGSGPALYVGWDHENRKWVIEHGRNPAERESNPRVEVVHSENPPVETIVEEFTGQDAEWIDVYNEPHIPRGRYAQLGKLIALYIKPAKGGQVVRIGAPESARADFPEYWNGRPPVVVSDSSAKQIYFVDGCQDVTEMLSAFGAVDHGNGLLELGQARRIDYQCRKEHVADPEEDLWKHTHGDENGELPTVLFDIRNKRLIYRGGDYRIDGAWIRN